jgi:hypothetical protein
MKRLIIGLLLFAPALSAHNDDNESATAWVVVRDDNSATMSGSTRDLSRARKYLKDFGPGYLWFRRGGHEYVVRDGKVVQTILDATQPQEALGHEQSAPGKRQAELGSKQAQLGREQAKLGAEQARTALRQARAEMNEDKAERKEVREHQREIEEAQEELSKGQEVLGREQEKIGREQERMGHEQERLSHELERRVEEVIQASLKDGTAKAVN